jgi:hypothetical protein
MKKSTILKMTAALAIMFLGYANSWGQEVAMPGGLHQFGKNSSDATVATENTDSVTVGAVMQYWAQPDPALVASPVNTYGWTITPALGSQTAGGTTNLATITFGATPGTGTIQVIQTSASGCAGSAVSYPVQSIAAPANTAIAFSALACPTGAVPYTLAGPTVTLTLVDAMNPGAQQIKVTYNLTGPGGSFTNITGAVANIAEGTQTINLSGVNLSEPGTYTFTITALSDRISRKSSVAGTLTVASNTFTVNRAPVTGPIFHVPNN